MKVSLEDILQKTESVLPSEEMFIEALRDLIKDEIKNYIKERMDENPEIKKEIRDAILEYIGAKVKETAAMTKIAKSSAKLAATSIPEELKDDVISAVMNTFKGEIDDFLKKTL